MATVKFVLRYNTEQQKKKLEKIASLKAKPRYSFEPSGLIVILTCETLMVDSGGASCMSYTLSSTSSHHLSRTPAVTEGLWGGKVGISTRLSWQEQDLAAPPQ